MRIVTKSRTESQEGRKCCPLRRVQVGAPKRRSIATPVSALLLAVSALLLAVALLATHATLLATHATLLATHATLLATHATLAAVLVVLDVVPARPGGAGLLALGELVDGLLRVVAVERELPMVVERLRLPGLQPVPRLVLVR
jgi:hypothetical protein